MIITPKNNDTPTLFDLVVEAVNTALLEKLSWMTNAFGIAHSLHKVVDVAKKYYPAVYMGKNEYLSMFPDEMNGNYSFVEVEDPQTYDSTVIGRVSIITRCSFIFWLNLSTIYEDTSVHRIENAKNEILKVLNTPGIIHDGRLTVNKIYQKPENVFRGFSISEIDANYMMFPFAGLRFECEVKTFDKCR